jgi:hypothetical protein
MPGLGKGRLAVVVSCSEAGGVQTTVDEHGTEDARGKAESKARVSSLASGAATIKGSSGRISR